MVTTSVGLRCAECARGQPPIMYQSGGGILGRAVGAGLAACAVLGVAWGLLITAGLGPRPSYTWDFWFSLIIGFGVAESISWAAKRRRGPNLQALGIALVLVAFAISRVVINLRLARPVPLDRFLADPLTVSNAFGLNLVMLIFLGLAGLIVWRRFQ